MSPVGNRQRYADTSPSALHSIAVHKDDSDTDYHSIAS